MADAMEQYCIDNQAAFYRLAYSYTRNQEDALDIVSEAMLKALKRKRQLRDPGAVKSWFYKILVNTALDFVKRRGMELMPGEEALLDWEAPPDRHEDADLHQAMDSLPPGLRTVVVLRFFEDMKLEDIAGVLGENTNTVKTRLYTALKRLRIELEDAPEKGAQNHGK